MKSPLAESLKNGEQKNIYLLYGSEDYLKHQYRDNIVKALLPGQDSMNYSAFVSHTGTKKEAAPMMEEIISLLVTPPFFAPRRVIVCENFGLFKNSYEGLDDSFMALPETTTIIILENDVDKRKKLYKTAEKTGIIEICEMPDSAILRKWINNRLKGEKKTMDPDAMKEFLVRTSSNMTNMDRELSKLLSYCMERDVITLSDVELLCINSIEKNIFNISNAIAAKQKEAALSEYAYLYRRRVEPREILRLLTSQFMQILGTKNYLDAGMSLQQIASIYKVKPYAIEMRAKSARLHSKKSLKQYIALSSDTLRKMNSGLIDARIAVELYILNCFSA